MRAIQTFVSAVTVTCALLSSVVGCSSETAKAESETSTSNLGAGLDLAANMAMCGPYEDKYGFSLTLGEDGTFRLVDPTQETLAPCAVEDDACRPDAKGRYEAHKNGETWSVQLFRAGETLPFDVYIAHVATTTSATGVSIEYIDTLSSSRELRGTGACGQD